MFNVLRYTLRYVVVWLLYECKISTGFESGTSEQTIIVKLQYNTTPPVPCCVATHESEQLQPAAATVENLFEICFHVSFTCL